MDEKISHEEVDVGIEVEKADATMGILVFKCLGVRPGLEDADGDIPDSRSMERAFYDFMANHPEAPVDFEHKHLLKGDIVAGWYFPEENCFRVAFRPEDKSVVEKADEIVGSSYAASVTRKPLREETDATEA